MFTRKFWDNALERAIKTAAQTAVALLLVSSTTGVLDVDWAQTASVAGLAAIVSILTSVAGRDIGKHGDPSLISDVSTDVDTREIGD